MSDIASLKKYINSGNIAAILKTMFDSTPSVPILREGFFHENSIWDYKSEVPGSGKQHELAWARIATHVLGFHNSEGGVLIFGINDKDFLFTGARNGFDSSRFNNAIRKYIGDLFYVTFSRELIQKDQSYLGIAVIPSRGSKIVSFASDSPRDENNKLLFTQGDIAIREGDSTKIYKGANAKAYLNSLNLPSVGRGYFVDDENYRILTPEYRHFVYRSKLCDAIMEGLHYPRTAVTSLVGIGGVGKTTLATWAAIELYKAKEFAFIVSVTAKDRELTAKSIDPLERSLTSYEDLLNTILRVLKFNDVLHQELEDKESFIKEVLKDSNGLLYIDNLETVDDQRIINFLDRLPYGVRALVTSRIPRIKISNYPIEVSTLDNLEVVQFVDALSSEEIYSYFSEMQDSDRLIFGNNCNRIPLVMKWIGARAKHFKEVLKLSSDINRHNATNDQLLEFSFRRVFETLSEKEKHILQVLSVFQTPFTTEATHIASDIPYQEVGDVLLELQSYSLIERNYDDELNDNIYTLLPITRVFAYSEVRKQINLEDTIRNRMRDWYDAKDIQDPLRRAITRGLRQEKGSSEEVMLQLADINLKNGNVAGAETILKDTVKKFPKSWAARRNLAELLRHYTKDISSDTIEYYRQAAALIPPSHKLTAAQIYREYAILLKRSGSPNSSEEVINMLGKAIRLNPKDAIAIHSLADSHLRIGEYTRSIELLVPLKNHPDIKTRGYVLRTLLKAYERSNDMAQTAYLKREMETMGIDF